MTRNVARSILDRTSVQHQLPLLQQQQAVAAVNAAKTSSIVNVAEPDHSTNGLFYTNMTNCGPVESSTSAPTAPAVLHLDFSFPSLEEDGLLYEQIADISTMDVDVSCSHYSDNELPTDKAGMHSADNSNRCDNVDSVTTDASSNKVDVDATNDIETDFSLLRKYDTYLSSGMGQMK
jgi:hypothetical protein